MLPAVSVIIPTYNRANLLKRAVRSVLDQTFRDFELIIINNYSSDNTLEVLKSFNDTRIKVMNFKNGGIVARSRNHGMIHSAGRYIAFLDDDDLWLPEKLEKQVHFLQKNPEYDIVYSNAWFIDIFGKKKHLFLKPKMFKQGNIFGDLIRLNFVPILSVLMKREVFERIGLFNEDPSINALEDYEYWMRSALHLRFGFIDEPLALYSDHSGGMAKKKNLARLKQKVLTLFLDDPQTPDKYKNDIIDSINKTHLNSAVYFLRKHEIMTAMDEISKYISYLLKHYRVRIFN